MDGATVKKLKAEHESNIAKSQSFLKALNVYETKAQEKAQAEDILREAQAAAKDAEKGVNDIAAEFAKVEAQIVSLMGSEPKKLKRVDDPKQTDPPESKTNPQKTADRSVGSKTIQMVEKKTRAKSTEPRKRKKPPFRECKNFSSRLSRFINMLLKTPVFKGRSIAKEASIGWHTAGYILCLLEEVDPPLRLVEHYGTKDAVYWKRTPLGDAVVEKCTTDQESRTTVVNGFVTLLHHYTPPKFDNKNDPMSKMYVSARKALERLPLPDCPAIRVQNPTPDFKIFHSTLTEVTSVAYSTRQARPFACTDCSESFLYRSRLEDHAKKFHPNRLSQVMAPYPPKPPVTPTTPQREIEARARQGEPAAQVMLAERAMRA